VSKRTLAVFSRLILYPCICVGSAFGQQLIGTYTLTTPANLAGDCQPNFYNPYYDCTDYSSVHMGSPILIPAVPGDYIYHVLGGSIFINGIPCSQYPIYPCDPTEIDIPFIWEMR
jgi:hypothetical protein